jgi:hypothetical protein
MAWRTLVHSRTTEEIQVILEEKGWPTLNTCNPKGEQTLLLMEVDVDKRTNTHVLVKCFYHDRRSINLESICSILHQNDKKFMLIIGERNYDNELMWRIFGTEPDIPQYAPVIGTQEYYDQMEESASKIDIDGATREIAQWKAKARWWFKTLIFFVIVLFLLKTGIWMWIDQ